MSPIYNARNFGAPRMFPPAIKWLIIINVSVWFLQMALGPQFYYLTMRIFALQPLETDLEIPTIGVFLPWQLISYQFMHDQQSIFHLFFNMFALWMFGREFESLWGSRRFVTYYILCGIGAGIIQLFISPMFDNPAPTIGASGAVYGILLAFGLTFPNRMILMFPFFIPIPAKIFVIIMAAIEMWSGLSGSDGVAHFAHLGGALTGLILLKAGVDFHFLKHFGKLFGGGEEKRDYTYSAPRETKTHRARWGMSSHSEPEPEEPAPSRPSGFSVNGEEITQAKIDEILDKITESGYQNLTPREKEILFELSRKLK